MKNNAKGGMGKMRAAARLITPNRKHFLFLTFFLAASFLAAAVSAAESSPGLLLKQKSAISGRLLLKDGKTPLSRGQVMFFNAVSGPQPSPSRYQRIPDRIASINPDGSFSIELEPGKYYMTAISRQSGERIGQPRKGDFVYKSRDEKGDMRIYTLSEGQHLDLGTIPEAVPFKEETGSRLSALAGIQGIVVDAQGNPVADAVVVAFASGSPGGKPLYASEKSGKDGRYVLTVGAGTYYLKLRKTLPGPPQPGQIIGFYGENHPVPVSVKEGELVKGIDIRAVPFPGRGPLPSAEPLRKTGNADREGEQ